MCQGELPREAPELSFGRPGGFWVEEGGRQSGAGAGVDQGVEFHLWHRHSVPPLE